MFTLCFVICNNKYGAVSSNNMEQKLKSTGPGAHWVGPILNSDT